jgi:DNA-directed RNA polymerase specialized sigma subunit
MVNKGMTDFREISKTVVSYYQYPDETWKRIADEMGIAEQRAQPVEAGGETVG